jgi:hypothetical protein
MIRVHPMNTDNDKLKGGYASDQPKAYRIMAIKNPTQYKIYGFTIFMDSGK